MVLCITCYEALSYSSEELGLGEAIVLARWSFQGTLGRGEKTGLQGCRRDAAQCEAGAGGGRQ